jgi:uncharacterized protein YllA (UPF0747 family)
VVTSRSSFTLVEPRAEKLLNRYHLTLAQTFVDPEHFRERLARALVPETVGRAFADAHDGLTHNVEALHRELEKFDHTLASSLAQSRAKMSYQLEKVRRKIERETLKRDERAAADAVYLANVLFPHRHLQERFYSILPFLAQHGMGLIDSLYEASKVECPDHRVLSI